MDKKSKLLVYINRIDSRLRGNDAQGYTARELVHALNNRSNHARSAMTIDKKIPAAWVGTFGCWSVEDLLLN